MKENTVTISIKGHLNEPIRWLTCTDFHVVGHDVIMATEDPSGTYTLYLNKKIHPLRKIILNIIRYIKSIFN